MKWLNTAERYGSLQIALHWSMLLLLAAVYACIELRGLFPKGSDLREALKAWHFMLGLTVLILATVRVFLHFAGPTPAAPPGQPRWQTWLGKTVHLALYVFMISMPVLGWLLLSSDAKPIPFFGAELPPLIIPNAVLTERLEELHETVGTIGYFLIGIHAAAALAHHYLLRDDTLRRMLPRRAAAQH